MDEEVPWPPMEKRIRAEDIDENECFIVRYNANDAKLEKAIKQIPYYFGCKYRYILWMHFVRKDLERLQSRKQALKAYISKLDEVRTALLNREDIILDDLLPRELRHTSLRRKHQQLKNCVEHAPIRRGRRTPSDYSDDSGSRSRKEGRRRKN